MVGAIRGWDILCHPVVTIRCFGWRVFWAALCAGRKDTFLSVLGENASSMPAMPEPLERSRKLELRAKEIYVTLARTFADNRPVRRFFTDLGEQEQDHADLLAMCWVGARRGGWNAEHFEPWLQLLPPLERRIESIESSLASIDSPDKAFRIVLDIESAEINPLFQAIVAASDSAFVKKLRPFHTAIETHISYIVMRLSDLAPPLMTASRELWERFPQMR
jgi:hypothetical protein